MSIDTKSDDELRAERLAAREAERKGDAQLDLPILDELQSCADVMLATATRVKALSAKLLNTTASAGLPLAQHVNNADAVARNLSTVTKALQADAEKALADG